MAANEIHVGDIGTIFEVTLMDDVVVVDVSAATTKEILFQKPDKTVVTQTAVFTTDGINGKIQYVSIANDLDLKGTWKIQARVVLPTGDWKSDISTFVVHKNLA